jgi:hypothetical protein
MEPLRGDPALACWERALLQNAFDRSVISGCEMVEARNLGLLSHD